MVGATLALVTAAGAADLPRRQPVVYQPTPVIGKMPIGKGPIGKSPIGKARPRGVAVLIRGIERGIVNLPLSATEGRSVANRPESLGLCSLAGFTLAVLLQCTPQSAC